VPVINCVRSIDIARTPRVMQLEGLFEIPPTAKSQSSWKVELPIEGRDWNIGLIVGASGSGKSTIAKEAFGKYLCNGHEWPADKSLVDAFPKAMSIKEITELLSSVGFSSPPSWLRPFSCLSNGEQFRATVARAMAEQQEIVAIDEFTSVVDRTVAQIGSAAIAKVVRRTKRKFIAVSCHYDIADWLQPDWILEMPLGKFSWRLVRRRPEINLTIKAVHRSAWELFRHHHYLDHNIHRGAKCFCAFIADRPVAFTSVLYFPHPIKPGWREHRTVCLPDFQGVGIGNALSEYVASLYKAAKGIPYRSTTSNPAMVRHRARSAVWKMIRKPGLNQKNQSKDVNLNKLRRTIASCRFTAGFEYVGQGRKEQALGFGI